LYCFNDRFFDSKMSASFTVKKKYDKAVDTAFLFVYLQVI